MSQNPEPTPTPTPIVPSDKWIVSTLAGDGNLNTLDGTGTSAEFNYPTGITVDSSGNIFVTQSPESKGAEYKIRKITSGGVVTSIGSGTYGYLDGLSSQAKFSWSNGIAITSSGILYLADSGNYVIRKILL